MTKTIKKLEKEKVTWKTKCENSNRSLVQMVDEVRLFTLKDKTSYFDPFFSLEIDGILSLFAVKPKPFWASCCT